MFTDLGHSAFMREALKMAEEAARLGEVPVGAVAVADGVILARAFNQRESKKDPLSHAEMEVIQELVTQGRGWRLDSVALYVTLEPCLMCMGALLQARISQLVFGAKDPKAGACGSLYDLSQDKRLNHQIEVVSGVLEGECSALLKDFFKQLRNLQVL